MKSKFLLFTVFLLSSFLQLYALNKINLKDSLEVDTTKKSKFDGFNEKAEKLFKIIPVPIVSYSQEAGQVFGLAKFNAFHLKKGDTLSGYSKVSGVFSISTKGFINASVAANLSFHDDKYILLGYINFRKAPELLLGVGNDVSIDNKESITTTRLKFVNYFMYNVFSDLYAGVGLDLTNIFEVKKDSTSFLNTEDYPGKDGGFTTGFGPSLAWDTRDNRYNAFSGSYIMLSYLYFANLSGSGFNFSTLALDIRKYFNPWYKHVIAIQVATNYAWGDVPFYELSQLGGEERMRGYYKGALRDKVLVDGQVEYRMPIWKIFGITAWVGTGRVADQYSNLNLDGFWLNYGLGIRIKVDSESNINLRFDIGFGNKGINGLNINFSEAF